MKKKILTIIFAGFTVVGLQAQTDAVVVDTAQVVLPWPQNIQAKLDTLTQDPMFESTQLGLLVYDLTADSALYARGAKQTLRPASTMKLLTAITALDRLGSDHQFRTTLYYQGEISNRTLNGGLYCVGGMDPLFDEEDMKAFVDRLRQLGVDTIRGHIIGDTSFKEADLLGEGWCWDDDNPQLTPLLISRKDEFLSRLVEKLREDSVVVEAPCSGGSLPKGAKAVCSRYHTLEQILMPMMKESDNLYAESVFFHIAASQGAHPAKATHGRQIIKSTLGKAGVSDVMYKLTDGSGLSLYNYVTPELEVCLLRYAYKNPSIFRNLLPTLPIAGIDGTLKKRMIGTTAQGLVKAKTGTVTGVSALAGYCPAPNGHLLAFCIINQGVMRSADGRAFQDRVCVALSEN